MRFQTFAKPVEFSDNIFLILKSNTTNNMQTLFIIILVVLLLIAFKFIMNLYVDLHTTGVERDDALKGGSAMSAEISELSDTVNTQANRIRFLGAQLNQASDRLKSKDREIKNLRQSHEFAHLQTKPLKTLVIDGN